MDLADDDTNVVDFAASRIAAYQQKVEQRTGLPVLDVIELALQAERRGANSAQVRAILNGCLTP